nr:MAG TPA: N6 adenosine methyltransferase subunit [Caudoviricetes sp.]
MYIPETPALPNKKYNIIYADPPWSYKDKGCNGNAAQQYPLMTDADICALPVKDIAATDCVLFMWATYPKLPTALDVIKAWGFSYKTIGFQWIKQNRSGNGTFFGLGRWTRGNTEPCLIATKGSAPCIVLDEEGSAPCLIATKGKPGRVSRSVSQLVFSPLRAHSQKPDEVRDRIVELMGNIPRIELFARSAASGWECWGNEAPGYDDWML